MCNANLICCSRSGLREELLLPCYIVALFDAADTAVHESEAYLHSSLLCEEKKNSQIQKQTNQRQLLEFFLAMLESQAC